jgi:hypothetical protein
MCKYYILDTAINCVVQNHNVVGACVDQIIWSLIVNSASLSNC